MTPAAREDRLAAARLRTGFDLHEAGVEMMELKLRRDDPTADDATIQARLMNWLGHGGFQLDRMEGMVPRPASRGGQIQ